MELWWQAYRNGRLAEAPAFLNALRQARHEAEMAGYESRFFGLPEDSKIMTDIQRLKAEEAYFRSEPFMRQHYRADWQHTDPRIQAFAARYIEAARREGIPLYVHGAFRTKEQQADAVKRGVSQVVWPWASHCQGKAVDIVHTRYHWDMTPSEWAYLGKFGKRVATRAGIKVEWGGDWRSLYDPAHWELADWRSKVREYETGPIVTKTPKRLLHETTGV